MTVHLGRLLTWKLNAAAAVTLAWWWYFLWSCSSAASSRGSAGPSGRS